MKIHHAHSIFDSSKPEFWIICSFLIMCLFLYRFVWPVIYTALKEQARVLKHTFTELTKRKIKATERMSAAEEKHRTVTQALKQREVETLEMIDHMRTTHAAQREIWQKHMIHSMDRSIDRETRKCAQGQADKIIDEIIDELGKDTLEVNAFRDSYTKRTLTKVGEFGELRSNKREKSESPARPGK